MAVFQVELKKVVDDSYSIEIGHGLTGKLIRDLAGGLVGQIRRFAVITDSTVEPLYARPLIQQLWEAGYQADLFSFPAGGKKARPGKQRRCLRTPCWRKDTAGTAVS